MARLMAALMRRIMQSRTITFFWLALLMAIGAYIRVHGADVYHYHADELMHIQIAKATSLKQLIQFSCFETHPPLGHILRHYWDMLSGAVWFTRSFSLLFGLALIPLYYLIGKKLDNKLAGLCAAILITFSHGCIIQSFVVRNYTVFLFFLSICFYYYLLWRDDRQNNQLLSGYTIAGLLAALTHFSAILAIFCIAAYETVYLYRSKSRAIKWIAVNCFLAAVFLLTYRIWNSSTASVHAIASRELAVFTSYDWVLLLLAYPFQLLAYILPGQYLIIILIGLTPLALSKNKTLPCLFIFAAVALLLAILLFIARIYPFASNRQELWLLPFLIPLAGCILADAMSCITGAQAPIYKAIAVLTVLFITYNPATRFDDSLEYAMTETEWNNVQNYLKQLGKDALIVSGRTDAIMLAPPSLNMYDYLGDTPSSISPRAAIISYYNTHLLFNNRDAMRIYDNNTLIRMLQDANAQNVLNGYTDLVFIDTYMTSDPMVRLITCAALDKQIVLFPPLPQGHVFAASNMSDYKTIFVIAKKRDFFNEVISPQGKAHGCLNL